MWTTTTTTSTRTKKSPHYFSVGFSQEKKQIFYLCSKIDWQTHTQTDMPKPSPIQLSAECEFNEQLEFNIDSMSMTYASRVTQRLRCMHHMKEIPKKCCHKISIPIGLSPSSTLSSTGHTRWDWHEWSIQYRKHIKLLLYYMVDWKTDCFFVI